jgi:hypothetical protein
LKVHLLLFFMDKKLKRSHRIVGIKVFLIFFAFVMKGSESVQKNY